MQGIKIYKCVIRVRENGRKDSGKQKEMNSANGVNRCEYLIKYGLIRDFNMESDTFSFFREFSLEFIIHGMRKR